ncbi:hypothetical protein SVIOM342S_01713 [Streptomyces violaceorubidus]
MKTAAFTASGPAHREGEPHRALAEDDAEGDGEDVAEGGGEADGEVDGRFVCCPPSSVRSISSLVSSMARWSASQVHCRRYSYPATSEGERTITVRPASPHRAHGVLVGHDPHEPVLLDRVHAHGGQLLRQQPRAACNSGCGSPTRWWR